MQIMCSQCHGSGLLYMVASATNTTTCRRCQGLGRIWVGKRLADDVAAASKRQADGTPLRSKRKEDG